MLILEEGHHRTDKGTTGRYSHKAELKYSDTIRGKQKRRCLPACRCIECEMVKMDYFTHTQDGYNILTHSFIPQFYRVAGPPKIPGKEEAHAENERRLFLSSRHRYIFAPPKTPENYWNARFSGSESGRLSSCEGE